MQSITLGPKTCDGCSLALGPGEGHVLPGFAGHDFCSIACMHAILGAMFPQAPATPADLQARRAAKAATPSV